MLCKFTIVLIVPDNCKFASHDLLLCLASLLLENVSFKNIYFTFHIILELNELFIYVTCKIKDTKIIMSKNKN